MKQHIRSYVAFTLTAATTLFLAGCGTVSDTVYLNDLSISGPIAQPAVHLTDTPTAGELHFSPKVSVNPRKSIDTRINGNMYSDEYTTTTGNNFHWALPTAQFGADCDYMLSNRVALSFGINYAGTANTDLIGGYAGLGLPFSGETISGRFEVGMQLQPTVYDAYSVVVREETPAYSDQTTKGILGYFHDRNKSSPWNMYTTLTINSHGGKTVDLFCSLSLSRQTLTDFQPSNEESESSMGSYHYTDARAEQIATVIAVTPGLVFSVGPTTKLLVGTRVFFLANVGNAAPVLAAPMIQFDMEL